MQNKHGIGSRPNQISRGNILDWSQVYVCPMFLSVSLESSISVDLQIMQLLQCPLFGNDLFAQNVGLSIYPTIICNSIFHWLKTVESIPIFFSESNLSRKLCAQFGTLSCIVHHCRLCPLWMPEAAIWAALKEKVLLCAPWCTIHYSDAQCNSAVPKVALYHCSGAQCRSHKPRQADTTKHIISLLHGW